MKRAFTGTLMVLVLGFCLTGVVWAADVIKVGFDIELTGDIPKVGEASKYAGEMLKEQINSKGGLKVGNKSYKLEFIYEDNEAKAESAAAAALKLITQSQVLGIVGPQASKQSQPERLPTRIRPFSSAAGLPIPRRQPTGHGYFVLASSILSKGLCLPSLLARS